MITLKEIQELIRTYNKQQDATGATILIACLHDEIKWRDDLLDKSQYECVRIWDELNELKMMTDARDWYPIEDDLFGNDVLGEN